MFQIFDFSIIEIVIPKPEIITITALVLLAAGIIPNLIPSILMCLIMLCKRRPDGLNEFSTQKPLSIVVLRKELICAITEHGTYRFPVVQQNISTYFQLRAVWDIYFAANSLEFCSFYCDIAIVVHRDIPPNKKTPEDLLRVQSVSYFLRGLL